MGNYKPILVQSKSWEAIENFYEELNKEEEKYYPILELVRYIKDSPLSKRIFGATSLDRLAVSIYDKIDFNSEVLIIRFSHQKQKWRFTYTAKPFTNPEWDKEYAVADGLKKFIQLVEVLKWND
jgi:hypothetical protein